MWQHDETVNAWSTCLHELKIHHEKEPRHRYSGNENRPDIVVYDSGCSYDLDVAMAHPFSQDTLKQAALEEGFDFKAGSFRGRFCCSKKRGKEDDQKRKTTYWQYIKPQFHSSGI